jgi:hypothetical protein
MLLPGCSLQRDMPKEWVSCGPNTRSCRDFSRVAGRIYGSEDQGLSPWCLVYTVTRLPVFSQRDFRIKPTHNLRGVLAVWAKDFVTQALVELIQK